MKYKRFLIFGYDRYYPSGGLEDVINEFDTVEEVKEMFILNNKEIKHIERDCDFYEILDLQEGLEININDLFK